MIRFKDVEPEKPVNKPAPTAKAAKPDSPSQEALAMEDAAAEATLAKPKATRGKKKAVT